MATGDLCSLADVKSHIKTDKSTGDPFLQNLISEASADIEAETGLRFYPKTETRKFHAIDDVDGLELLLDMPLLTVTAITNGDGTSIDVDDDILLEPANTTPKVAIALKSTTSLSWTYSSEPRQAISVTGSWGMEAATPPAYNGDHGDIRLAATMLAVHYYKVRGREGDRLGMPEAGGEIRTPSAWPPEVRRILKRKTRPRLAVV